MKLFLSTMLLVGSLLQAGEIHRSFSSETKAILKFETDSIRAVPALKNLVDNRHANKFRGMISNFTGVDLNSTYTLWIGALGNDQAVIVMEGDYDVDKIRNTCQTHGYFEEVSYSGVEYAVIMPDEKKPGKINQLAVLDQNILVFGEPELAEAYVKNFTNSQTSMSEEKLEKVKSLSEDQGLFHAVVLEHKKKDKHNPLLKQLSAMEMNVSYDQAFKFSMMMKSSNKELLEPLKQMIEGIIGLGQQMHIPKVPKVMKEELLGNAAVTVNGDQININTQMNPEIIQNMLKILVY